MTEDNSSERESPATVLVVEDDQPLLEFFSVLLRREGYRILVAANGLEALAMVESNPNDRIDILLSDVAMPYMGGIQLAESLMDIWPEIQVLLISGLPHQVILDRCGPSFKPHFLPKPFSVSDISEKIKQLTAVASAT